MFTVFDVSVGARFSRMVQVVNEGIVAVDGDDDAISLQPHTTLTQANKLDVCAITLILYTFHTLQSSPEQVVGCLRVPS